jgi:tetratricopeptide (TPR) repeat protein
MQLQKIELKALITLLAGVTTPVIFTEKGYSLKSGANNLPDQEIAQNQTELNPWLKQGEALLNKDNYAEALKIYEQAIKINPNSTLAWHGHGEALYGLKQLMPLMKP